MLKESNSGLEAKSAVDTNQKWAEQRNSKRCVNANDFNRRNTI